GRDRQGRSHAAIAGVAPLVTAMLNPCRKATLAPCWSNNRAVGYFRLSTDMSWTLPLVLTRRDATPSSFHAGPALVRGLRAARDGLRLAGDGPGRRLRQGPRRPTRSGGPRPPVGNRGLRCR